MNKRITYLLVFFLLMGAVLYFSSDRVVSLGIVNSLEEVNTVEVIVDGKSYQTIEFEPSGTLEVVTHLDLPLGYHTVAIRSHTCDLNAIFEVLNLVGYTIHLEYYQNHTKQCEMFQWESYFSVME